MLIVSEDLLRAFYRLFLFTVLWFKWSVKMHCAAKVFLAIWDIFLHENSRNYNSYRSGYKFAFILFLYFSYKPKTRIRFSTSWWSGEENYFCFLFIASRALFQSHANWAFVKEFSYMLFYDLSINLSYCRKKRI